MRKIILIVAMASSMAATGQSIESNKIDQFTKIRNIITSTEFLGATGDIVWQSIFISLKKSIKSSNDSEFTVTLLIKDISHFRISAGSTVILLLDNGEQVKLYCASGQSAFSEETNWTAEVPYKLPIKYMGVLSKYNITALRIMSDDYSKDIEKVKAGNTDVLKRLIAICNA